MLQYNIISVSVRQTEIKIVTKEVYDANSRNWTHRAGTFLEQSRALIDTYLGRWDRNNLNAVDNDDEEDTMQDIGEECTSGEEVWGTPTSGENDEMQMFNSDQTHSVNFQFCFVQLNIGPDSIRAIISIQITVEIVFFVDWRR